MTLLKWNMAPTRSPGFNRKGLSPGPHTPLFTASLLLAQEDKGELVDGYMSNTSNKGEAQLILVSPNYFNFF